MILPDGTIGTLEGLEGFDRECLAIFVEASAVRAALRRPGLSGGTHEGGASRDATSEASCSGFPQPARAATAALGKTGVGRRRR